MARHGPSSAYNSETFGQNVSFKLEQPIGSMSISPSGRDVVLASKEGLHIIDLDSPYSPPRYLAHRTPWEVADVQWSPHASKDYWVASTSNQKALVWNLASKGWQGSIEFVLHAHSRAITDINFSAHNPWVLATCAVDSFVHSWDLRSPQKPAISFSDWFAGATQVKWSRQDEHVIASSHDRFLHIWDDRHGAAPVKTIEAHGTKIYGIDWNRFEPSKLVTCSLDRTIKFWNFTKDGDEPERIIETPFPVWRARYTPFGWGLMAMPQRGNSDLHLYDRRPVDGSYQSGKIPAVATFTGHDGYVKEFLWRAGGTIANSVDNRDFQLVSWGTDRELRLQRVERETLKDVGYVKGVNTSQRLNFTRKGAVYRTFRDDPEELDLQSDGLSRSDTLSTPHQSVASRHRINTGVGMSKYPVFQFRGWVSSTRTKQRRGMHGKAAQRQNMTPIAWLKNVRIASWDQDSLADEIRQVGEKFKRVDFELVDITHRKTVVCLQAPWGERQTSVYLRVELRFPKLYPQSASAVVLLQKNSAISEDVHKMIVTELQTISETYSSRKRGCIEGLLRYLLMEQPLEQIVAWVLGESLADSKVMTADTMSAAESSDDEDDRLEIAGSRLDSSANARTPIPKGCGAIWSESGILVCFFEPKIIEDKSTTGTLETGLVNQSQSSKLYEGFGQLRVNSPHRKTTYETASEQDVSDSGSSSSSTSFSSTSTASTTGNDRLQGNVLPLKGALAGLHLKANSTDRSNRSTILGRLRQDDATRSNYVSLHDFSDLLPCKKELAQKYVVFGDGQQVCEHNSRVAQEAHQNDLSAVWQFAGMILRNNLPLKLVNRHNTKHDDSILVLARQASKAHRKRASADSAEAGNHHNGKDLQGKTRWGNSPLGARYLLPALFHHFEKLADVQTLALLSCVFAAAPSSHKPGTLASDMGPDARMHHSVGDAHYFPSSRVANSLRTEAALFDGYVFIQPMVDYVPVTSQSLRDIRHNVRRKSTIVPSSSHLVEQYAQASTRRSSRAASISFDDANDATSIHVQSLSTSPENPRHRDRASSGIGFPSAKASLSALTGSYSQSPPAHISGAAAAAYIKKYSPSSSLTPGQWVANNIFGTAVANRTNRSSHHQNEAKSTHNQLSNLRSRSSLTSLHSYHKDKDSGVTPDHSQRTTRNNSIADLASRGSSEKTATRRTKIKTSLHNQECFDLEAYSPKPLLDPKFQINLKIYRTCYAHLLDVWDLPIQKAELLKLDARLFEQADTDANVLQSGRRPSHSAIRTVQRSRRMTAVESEQTEPALHIRRCCQRCGSPFAAIEKNGIPIAWHCANVHCTTRPHKTTERNNCVICHSALQGLAIPCLQCGHITCYECCTAWFGPSRMRLHTSRESTDAISKIVDNEAIMGDLRSDILVDDDLRSCPSGCGCQCQNLSSITVPYPPARQEEETPLNKPTGKQRSNKPDHFERFIPTPSNTELLKTPTSAVAALNRVRSKSLAKDAAMSSRVRSGIKRAGSSFGGALGSSSSAALATMISESTIESDDEEQTHSSPKKHDPPLHQRPSMTGTQSNSGSDSSLQVIHKDAGWDNYRDDQYDPLDPWAGSKIASLGRGIGAGLSRGLSSKASDSTIRKLSGGTGDGSGTTGTEGSNKPSTRTGGKGRKSG